MVILVTGCRSGFGKLIAVQAARKGHIVYAGLRDITTSAELETSAAGLELHILQLDVTKAEERNAAISRIIEEQGELNGLVNNAGVALGGFLEQIEEDELRHVFEVNVFGLWALTCAALPHMRQAGSGKIVNLSSASGFMAFPALGAYASSKFALEGMSESWRHELALFGIDVYLVQPSAYATDIWNRNRKVCRNAHAEGDYRPWVDKVDAAFRQLVENSMQPPEEVAVHVVKLLTEGRKRLRHPMGPGTLKRRILKNLLPFSVVEYAIRRALMRALP